MAPMAVGVAMMMIVIMVVAVTLVLVVVVVVVVLNGHGGGSRSAGRTAPGARQYHGWERASVKALLAAARAAARVSGDVPFRMSPPEAG